MTHLDFCFTKFMNILQEFSESHEFSKTHTWSQIHQKSYGDKSHQIKDIINSPIFGV